MKGTTEVNSDKLDFFLCVYISNSFLYDCEIKDTASARVEFVVHLSKKCHCPSKPYDCVFIVHSTPV